MFTTPAQTNSGNQDSRSGGAGFDHSQPGSGSNQNARPSSSTPAQSKFEILHQNVDETKLPDPAEMEEVIRKTALRLSNESGDHLPRNYTLETNLELLLRVIYGLISIRGAYTASVLEDPSMLQSPCTGVIIGDLLRGDIPLPFEDASKWPEFHSLIHPESGCQPDFWLKLLLRINGNYLRKVPDQQLTHDIILTAVKADGLALRWVPQELELDSKIVVEACQQNPAAIQYAGELFSVDKKVMTKLVGIHPALAWWTALSLIAEIQTVPDSWKKAYDSNWEELHFKNLLPDEQLSVMTDVQTIFEQYHQYQSSEDENAPQERLVILSKIKQHKEFWIGHWIKILSPWYLELDYLNTLVQTYGILVDEEDEMGSERDGEDEMGSESGGSEGGETVIPDSDPDSDPDNW